MSDHPDTSRKLVQKAAEKYSEMTSLRAAVQLIPYIGGTLDTLIGGEGQKIQQRRIAHFINELDKRLNIIDEPKQALANEDLYDIMFSVLEQVVKTRSEEKRARFAQIVVNEISHVHKLEDATTAIHLISELDDLHIKVLNTAIHANLHTAVTDGLRAISISNANYVAPDNATNFVLMKAFPDTPEHMLRFVCSELVSKGLLRDEGVGRRIGAGSMEFFAATSLASWLFTWLQRD